MSLKLSSLDPKLRRRIEQQIANEDKNKHVVVAGLQAQVSEPYHRQALVGGAGQPHGGKSGVVVRVTIVAVRKRLLDSHDNAKSACKSLVDAISASLGIADNDPRVAWEISQVETKGSEGTMVKIEL